MKLTKSKLRQIIQEEMKALKEYVNVSQCQLARMRKILPYKDALDNPDWPIINGEKLDVEGCIEKLKLPEDDEWVLAVQAQETGPGLKSRVIKRKIDMEKERGGPRPKTRIDMPAIDPKTGDTRPYTPSKLRLQEIVKEELTDIIKKKRKTQKNRK